MSDEIYLPCTNEDENGGNQGFGLVEKHLGKAIYLIRKSDGRSIKVKQRGGMSRKKKGKRVSNKIKPGDWIMFSERDLGGNVEGDILLKYTENEVRWLQLNGYIQVWEGVESDQSSNVVFVEAKAEKKVRLERELPSSDDEEEEEVEEDDEEMKEEEVKEDSEEEEEDFFQMTGSKAKKSKKHKDKGLIGFLFVDDLYKRPCDKRENPVPVQSVTFTQSFQNRTTSDVVTVKGTITRWDRSRGFGEAVVVLEMKERVVSIPRHAIQASVRQGLLTRDKVLFPRDRITLSIFEGERGFEASTISI